MQYQDIESLQASSLLLQFAQHGSSLSVDFIHKYDKVLLHHRADFNYELGDPRKQDIDGSLHTIPSASAANAGFLLRIYG